MDPTAYTIAAVTAVVLIHFGARWYSKRTYDEFACRACAGTGKDFEPVWLMWLCLRSRKRAFRKCLACRGTGRYTR